MAEGAAPARTALAGNPSDGYGGAIVTVTLDEFGAQAVARPAPQMRVKPASGLVEATVRRFEREHGVERVDVEVDWRTSIPEGVGLGGSSAIVIAVERALAALYEVDLEPSALAASALAVEREDLGIAGGRQDQVVQAYGGLVFIDFADDPSGRCEPLDSALLPPLVVAWREDAAKNSGVVHAGLRARYAAGDERTHDAMRELASLAARARSALLTGDRDEFGGCVDETFDLRASIMRLDPRHVAMVKSAREADAPANYSGSGGAIVAVCRDREHQRSVGEHLRATGAETVARGAG